MQSPSPNGSQSNDASEKPRNSGSDVEFGKASPLRNPLHGSKKPSSNIFIPKPRTSQLKGTAAPRLPSFHDDNYDLAFHKSGFRVPAQASSSNVAPNAPPPFKIHNFEPNATRIDIPTNPPLKTLYPPSRPMFPATSTGNSFNPTNRHVVDLTNTRDIDDDDDDRFDPDAAIRTSSGSFGAQDPYMYVDPNEANKNIKSLLEGAFEDDDQKSKIRLRGRINKVAKLEKEKSNLANKLAALAVKDAKDEKAEGEDEEDEEEDGTVDGLTVKLLPHQVEGVSWMIDKEISKKKVKGVLPHGGILADDMGLGKTVQSVTLILTNPRPALDAKPEHSKQKMPGKDVGSGTLVVAPLALIKQWEAEIKSKVAKSHALKVLVHHGSSRTKSGEQLKKYDVVITTYQTLTSEHAGSNMGVAGGARIGCMGVSWYRVILDEAHTIKNRNAKSTQACYALNAWYRWCLTGTPMQNNLDELQSLIKFLRIKPYCELPSWKEQIITPMKNGRGGLAMRRLQYFLRAFMKRRTKDILKQEGALNFGGKTDKGGESKGGMQIVQREVLTVECNLDASEQEFYDRLQARADKRLQDMESNGKNDYIGALVLLLRLRQACDHPRLVEKSMGRDKDAMTTGMPSSQVSRNGGGDEMDDLTALMGGVSVQNKNCDVCQATLSAAEARDGAVRCSECEADLAAVKKTTKKAKHGKEKKTESVAKQRRARNRKVIEDSDDEGEGEWIARNSLAHEDLGKAGGSDDEDADGGGESLNTMDSERSEDEDSDIEDSPSRATRRARPKEEEVDEDGEDESEEEESESEEEEEEEGSDSEAGLLDGMAPSGKAGETPSTKIRQLLRILHKESPEHKTIVFSQFTTMLDLIEPHLKHAGLRYVRYDGSMRPDAREDALNSLRSNPQTRVLLCSLKCGSLGLNLTAASRVVIVEPFWNPFVEEQAIDRVHRLNQTVDVKVFRLTIRNSVEERIIDLQERKRELAKAAIEGGKGVGKLSMQDILGLFKRDAEHGPNDKEDLELWQKFGGESRLLDGPASGPGYESPRASAAYGSRPMAGRGGRRGGEHEVYGRRW